MPTTDPDERAGDASLPVWVKVFGMVVLALAAVAVIVALVTGGHGPGRHGVSLEAPAGLAHGS